MDELHSMMASGTDPSAPSIWLAAVPKIDAAVSEVAV